ncbi:MAG TPA: 2-oxo acid dehydrogenase subunit E2 [Vicinamibacterales bacterium]|nr:2-oxo acid dehydrogenase subunit E2 [Vicinamibacterales bacterium]
MPAELKLPELGENVEKGDVVRVLVKAGDVIKKDQPVVELETDKATIEVPSDVDGTVTDVKVKPGDRVKVGQVILMVDAAAAAAAPKEAAKPSAVATPPPASAPSAPSPSASSTAPAQSKPAAVVDIASARPARVEPAQIAGTPAGANVAASPSVRRYARELGVDLSQVPGSGPGGRIGQDDVTAFVKRVMTGTGGAPRTGGAAVAHAPLPDFSKWGAVDIKPMSNIRRKTAEHLSVAWQAPHVTQHDKADVTGVEEFRKLHGARAEKDGAKLTVTAIVIKIVSLAIEKYPQFASSVDMANEQIVYKQYCHIGVAVDTPNGLLVPVIRDVDQKSISQIAKDLAALSQKARDRKLSLDEMSGGVISITNLGGIGGTSFTPIVNQPEVAILGLSRTAIEPVWQDDKFVPRPMLPLSLSYDHRVIDGADAARFLRFVADALEQPLSIYL